MAIYKQCTRCRNRLPSGTKCSCISKRHKEYDRYARDKTASDFYKSGEWRLARQQAISKTNGLDIYSLFILNKIEYGEVVHHIEPLKEAWSKRVDPDNLIYLTEQNHQQIHKLMSEEKDIKKTLKGLLEKYKQQGGA